MAKVDFTWVKQQLTAGRVIRKTGDSALALLKVWDDLNLADSKDAADVVAVFSKLAMGHALVVDETSDVWVPAMPGKMKVGDVVRVKFDAFAGDLGRLHNGRVGVVTAIRYGDIIVKTTDGKTPQIDGAHYSPFHLEKRV